MKEDKLHHHNWEEVLRKQAENFEMQPSDAVWEHISTALPSGRKRFYVMRWVAAAAVLLFLVGSGWYFLHSPSGGQKAKAPALVLTDSVQKAPDGEGGELAGRTATQGASRDEGTKRAAVPKNEPSKLDDFDDADEPQKKALYSSLQPKKASPGRLFSEKTREKRSTTNSRLSLLAHLNPLPNREGFKEEATTSVYYSERVIRLMLAGVHPDAPLLARGDAAASGKNKITFGIYFTPGVSYRTLKTGGAPSSSSGRMMASPSPPNTDIVQSGNVQEFASSMRINTTDKPLQQKQSWGWGSGIRVALHLPDNWLLQSGLSLRHTNYAITAYRQDPTYVYNNGTASTLAAAPLANSNYAQYASRYAATDQATTLENTYLSTELPLLIGRRFGSPDAFSVTVLAGAGLTYLLHANSVMYAPNSQRYFTDEDYLSPFNSSLILEANMNIPLGERLGFSIGPALQYQLFSSYKSYDPVKEFPYLIGLKTAFHLR